MLQAFGDRVIVLEDVHDETSAGGVFLPPSAREETNKGTVVSVGNRVTDVKVGDVVLFTKYEGREHKEEGKTFVILREGEIPTVIE